MKTITDLLTLDLWFFTPHGIVVITKEAYKMLSDAVDKCLDDDQAQVCTSYDPGDRWNPPSDDDPYGIPSPDPICEMLLSDFAASTDEAVPGGKITHAELLDHNLVADCEPDDDPDNYGFNWRRRRRVPMMTSMEGGINVRLSWSEDGYIDCETTEDLSYLMEAL